MIVIVNFMHIEKKWQKIWEESGVFESNVEKREKFFITFPYPYVNGAPHVGHSFSSFRCDVCARYKRMQGYNVLFPQGFHATGEPILGAIERLKNNDPVQINTFKSFGATDEDIEKFKTDMTYVVKFWMKRWIEDMKASGMSIDWRRTFVTAITPQYSKFIEWQYNTLKNMGYVTQGTHPVIWCPHCQSPTGDHDRLEGEGESPIDYVVLKFKMVDDVGKGSPVYLPAATLRPETIYGVTNVWINPDVDYVIAKVNDELWIISEECVDKLKDQLNEVEAVDAVRGREMVGKRCIDPIGNKEIPILPAKFVDPESATGVVMSVPSHAPHDWMAVKEIIDSHSEMERFGVTKQELDPISIIKTEGLGDHPAIDVCKSMNIKSSAEKNALDEATSAVYKREYHLGVLKKNCGEYSGMKVSEIKNQMLKDFIDRKIADLLWDCNLVVCRCTTRCHVKILENQWFLKFSDEKWKSKVRRHLKKMAICPEEARVNFENTIDWLKDKACARKTGLGTKLPWDNEWIVETLSDSTIYMAYYTIAKTINQKKVHANKLIPEVFDYVFLGKGTAANVLKKSGLHVKTLNEMKQEFSYFYPVDMRNSGKDLIQNHLTFFMFHHVALFPEKYWPRAIGVNGFVNVEGEKMSKSKGNFLPLKDLLESYGADLTRVNIIAAAEGLDDADWRAENVKGYRNRLETLYEMVEKMSRLKTDKQKQRNIDRWLLSRIQDCIKNSTESYEKMKLRSAVHYSLFEPLNALRWYQRRAEPNNDVLNIVLKDVVKLIAPVTPHLSEEIWKMAGGKDFISTESWPKINRKFVDKKAEMREEFLRKTLEDIKNIKNIVKMREKKEAKAIKLFVAETKKFKNPAGKKNQLAFLKECQGFLSRESGCKITIVDANKVKTDSHVQKAAVEKAKKAMPDKLGILIE